MNAIRRFTPVVSTPAGPIPRVASRLGPGDIRARLALRWGKGRNDAKVQPGLYAVGNPGADAPVLVTANYRMSFDLVRGALGASEGKPEIDAFLLVLDTKGVNVWCAAGKGSFGTAELAHRVGKHGLSRVVGHRVLVVPQLGATGVAAHEIRRLTGFELKYGPVRAADIRAYLEADMRATPKMRRVRFSIADRLAVAPVEFVHSLPALPVIAALAGIIGLPFDGDFVARFARTLVPLVASLVAGTLLFPALLPFIPFKAFSLKGAALGIAVAGSSALLLGAGAPAAASLALSGGAVGAFLSMQFTGSSTFTNLRGAKAEVERGVPAMVAGLVAGLIGLVAARIMGAA